MMSNSFQEWLNNEMGIRGLTQRSLAKSAGLSQGAISNVMSGIREPGSDFCTAIADALNYPPDYVFRKAGLLPDLDDEIPPEVDELNQRYLGADEDTQREILDFVRFKTDK